MIAFQTQLSKYELYILYNKKKKDLFFALFYSLIWLQQKYFCLN